MPDLSTTYLGLKLKNPLIASASPLCEKVENIRRMEDSGAAAVVLHSLFEEQILLEGQGLDYSLSQGAESFSEALTYFPNLSDYKIGPEEYLEHIRKSKEAVDIPIIASLNGISSGGWVRYAKKMQEAGADAIELNVYYIPTDTNVAGPHVEQQYVELVNDVKKTVSIPVAVKIGSSFSSIANMARSLDDAGADAIVMFNRFYQPDFDLEKLEVVPNLNLSTPGELRLRLRWAAILYSHIQADIAITGGVHTSEDVIKCMMAGARVAMMTSAILMRGTDHFMRVLDGMIQWMEDNEYETVELMRGSMSQRAVANPAAFERANYLKVLSSYGSH